MLNLVYLIFAFIPARAENICSAARDRPGVARLSTVDEQLKCVLSNIDPGYIIDLTRRLVATRSVYDPAVPGATEEAAARLVAAELSALGLAVHVEEVAPGRPNVIADWQGSAPGPTLLFEGHTDVVTEGNPARWTYPPFSAELVDGRIYGRGSADMKSGIAAAVGAVRALARSGLPYRGRIRLAVLVDEEDLMLGVKHFIRSGWAKGVDGAIVCEPEQNEVCLIQKGAMRVRVEFTGVMAHGAMPQAGVNPIPWAAEFIQALGRLEARLVQEHGENVHLGRPSLTPTIVQAPAEGPPQLNVIPAAARVFVDVRTIPGVDHRRLEADMRAILSAMSERDPRVRAELEVFEDRPWTETPPDTPIAQAVAEACRRAAGREPVYGGVPGATDGTFLSAWAGIPIVTLGPGDRYIPHQVDEYVEVDQVIEAARIYAASAVLFSARHPESRALGRGAEQAG
ncbi:MAG: M20 family metallopeptidase [Firmicutes bacterium]|nr:M20 family metallopeptidase [Bacillota bacterium]